MSILDDWPTYLLKNIPPEIRSQIEDEAGAGAMSEVIRRILCAHYSLDCEPVLTRNKFLKVDGTETMVLRLQPELWKAIKRDAKRRKIPTRSVIIEALKLHYTVT